MPWDRRWVRRIQKVPLMFIAFHNWLIVCDELANPTLIDSIMWWLRLQTSMFVAARLAHSLSYPWSAQFIWTLWNAPWDNYTFYANKLQKLAGNVILPEVGSLPFHFSSEWRENTTVDGPFCRLTHILVIVCRVEYFRQALISSAAIDRGRRQLQGQSLVHFPERKVVFVLITAKIYLGQLLVHID